VYVDFLVELKLREFHASPTLIEEDARSLEDLSPRREQAVNGWDGIFTNPFLFADLFKPYLMFCETSEKRMLEQRTAARM
jgi:hypothetical protein